MFLWLQDGDLEDEGVQEPFSGSNADVPNKLHISFRLIVKQNAW